MIPIEILMKSARRVVLELKEKAIYETKPYEIWINGKKHMEAQRMIQTVDGLLPDEEYTLQVRRPATETKAEGSSIEEESEILSFHTDYEYVTLNVRDFGAYGDGEHDDTAAIQAAILCCPEHSRVVVPRGSYLITGLFLKSNLILELLEGAVLAGIYDRTRVPVLPGMIEAYQEDGYYNLGSWEGNPLDMHVSLLTGISVKNVLICGRGTLDGRADFTNWWLNSKEKGRAWRPRMIFLNRCENVIVDGITIQNSPAWNLHPYFSKNLKFLDLRILGPANSHNTDGCDPESCSNVEIAGVYFSVGDDCIAVKSGKIYMGQTYQTPSEHILIRQSLMQDGHGGVTLGSEIAAGVYHLTVRDCRFLRTDRGLRVKTRRGRGKDSVLDDIVFENIQMDGVKTPFVVNSFYFCDPDGKSDYVSSKEPLPVDERTPEIRELIFRDIECRNAEVCGAYLYGLPEQKIKKVTFERVSIGLAENASSGIAAMMIGCEESAKRGLLLFNIEQAVFHQVVIHGQEGTDIELHGVDAVEKTE